MDQNDTTKVLVEADQPASGPSTPRPAERASSNLTEPRAGASRSPTNEILAALVRMEEALGEVRAALDATLRAQRHHEFSPARLLGSILQALVIGLLLWAVSDWVFGEPRDGLLIKLAFTAVLQLVALTAFVLGRETD